MLLRRGASVPKLLWRYAGFGGLFRVVESVALGVTGLVAGRPHRAFRMRSPISITDKKFGRYPEMPGLFKSSNGAGLNPCRRRCSAVGLLCEIP